MNRSDALKALEAEGIDIRLEAARFLALNARRADLAKLQAALKGEPVRWIRTALERAVERAQSSGGESRPTQTSAEPSQATIRDVRAEAVEEVAGTIIHEFSPIVGLLRIQARGEISQFESSDTKKSLDMLGDLLRGVRELKASAAVPHYDEADLSTLALESADRLEQDARSIVAMAGPEPFIVTVDKDRIKLAIVNGLRNAVEAAIDNAGSKPPSVVVNWGKAGTEDWLAILDSGAGFQGNPNAALRLGATNKPDHIGFGLTTAQQAMRVMEGDVYLSNSASGGAQFEIRWFRADANPIR